MSLAAHAWSPAETAALSEALARREHLPFTRGFGLPREGALRWIQGQFEHAAQDGGALVVSEGGRLVGGLVLVRAAWESGLYGASLARVPFAFTITTGDEHARAIAHGLLDRLERVLAAWSVDHVSALALAEDVGLVRALSERGWVLVDSTLDLTWACGRTTPAGADPSVVLREAVPSDREPLAALARASYTRTIQTRFSADPWLSLEVTGELYARWFELALDGEFGDVVVVAEVDGRPVGFNTFKLDPALSAATGVGFAQHGIAAVEPEFRGRAGQPAMLHWLAEWQRRRQPGARFNRGRVLITNYPMQRACIKSGGFTTQAFHTFHRWCGPDEPPRRGAA